MNIKSGIPNSELKDRPERETHARSDKPKVAPPTESNIRHPCPPDRPKPPGGDVQNRTFRRQRAEYYSALKSCVNSLLRNVRVEVEEVVRLIEQHVAGELDIFRHIGELESSKNDVKHIIADIKNTYLDELPPSQRDTYWKIINIWELTENSPFLNPATASDPIDSEKEQERLRELNLLKSRLERLTYYIVYQTGMERINNWIAAARPGYALPFHAIVEDELQSQADRERMLGLYSLLPKGLKGGLIDVTKGIIMCYPLKGLDRAVRHLISILQLVLWFSLIFWITGLLVDNSNLVAAFGLEGPPVGRFSLVLIWTALLLGILAHILVAGAKAPTAGFRQFPMPVRDWDFYLSSRTSVVMFKSALAFLVFWTMFLSLKGELSLFEAFLIGYSFDSVVELVGVSLEKRAQTNLGAIKERLGVSA